MPVGQILASARHGICSSTTNTASRIPISHHRRPIYIASNRCVRVLATTSEADSSKTQGEGNRIKQTLADLDALLGIEEEPEEEEAPTPPVRNGISQFHFRFFPFSMKMKVFPQTSTDVVAFLTSILFQTAGSYC